MQIIGIVNGNHKLRCSVCGEFINDKSWWFNIILFSMQNFFFKVSVCRACADTPVCDIIQSIKRRKTWWYKTSKGSLQTGLLMGGFAATLDQHLVGGGIK